MNLINSDARANRIGFRIRSSCVQFCRMRERERERKKGYDSRFNETQIKFIAQVRRIQVKKEEDTVLHKTCCCILTKETFVRSLYGTFSVLFDRVIDQTKREINYDYYILYTYIIYSRIFPYIIMRKNYQKPRIDRVLRNYSL